jgi:hypothetical protein
VEVAASDHHVYVADRGGGLRAIDVSAPDRPLEVGFIQTPDYSTSVVLSGDYAWVTCRYAGLRAIDISNPARPVEVGFAEFPERAAAVAVEGGFASSRTTTRAAGV